MRFLSILLLCAALLGTSQVLEAHANNQDESAIRGVVDGFAKSWNTPGMPGFSDLFTRDADFAVISGKWFEGRDEFVSYHKNLLNHHYKGSRLLPEKVSVRFLSPGVAVARVDWRSWYMEDGKEQEQTALMTLTLTNQEGAWKIAAAHNTLTGGPRYTFHPPTTGK